MVGLGQVLTDANTEESQESDSLHHSFIDGDKGVSFSLSSHGFHNQLLFLADVEMKVVVLSIWCLMISLIRAMMFVSLADLMIVLELWCEQRIQDGPSMKPGGVLVLRVKVLPTCTPAQHRSAHLDI